MRALRRGTNLSRVAGFNEAVVIDAIRRARDGLSRVEVAEQTGLSAQTVSNIVRRMLESGLLLEGDRVTRGLGKPRTPLTLDPQGRYAVGVHLDPLFVTVVVVSLRGEVVAHMRMPSPAQVEPTRVIADLAEAVPALLDEAGVPGELVAGVGVAAPGPIDVANGSVLAPPHLPRWRYVPVVDELAAQLGLPVLLDKDVVAGAIGERWTGATLGQAHSLFLYLSTGIGLGVADNDSIIRGSTGNAGDIGHLNVDDNGPLCECGRRGCLGATLSPAALVEQAVQSRLLAGRHLEAVHASDPVRVDESFAELCALVDAGEPGALVLVDASARQLAKAISTLANLFDTDAVAIGGPTWMRLRGVYLPRLEALVAADLLGRPGDRPVALVGTVLGDDVIAVGAACLVLDRAFAPAVTAIALEA
ncbi:ROK family protein [Micropruina sonneratiae]|uniref:ROK family protein n=1 Tax=Micropruina sonneratiae TaxID=2986940 RepID=UPI002226AD1F|nr:ROK family transcriptional regulator [Micropruina sp. KQZ13P-5]MCW3158048.1 ROK family transcriptional regulator [Micropruina sp. KQZ13P-5]